MGTALGSLLNFVEATLLAANWGIRNPNIKIIKVTSKDLSVGYNFHIFIKASPGTKGSLSDLPKIFRLLFLDSFPILSCRRLNRLVIWLIVFVHLIVIGDSFQILIVLGPW